MGIRGDEGGYDTEMGKAQVRRCTRGERAVGEEKVRQKKGIGTKGGRGAARRIEKLLSKRENSKKLFK